MAETTIIHFGPLAHCDLHRILCAAPKVDGRGGGGGRLHLAYGRVIGDHIAMYKTMACPTLLYQTLHRFHHSGLSAEASLTRRASPSPEFGLGLRLSPREEHCGGDRPCAP